MDWLERALCRGKHQDIWHPPAKDEGRPGPENEYYDIGKLVCYQCPVREKCLQLASEEVLGLWGGQTPTERRTGVIKPPKKVLPLEHMDVIPNHTNERLDIRELKARVKTVTKRKPR